MKSDELSAVKTDASIPVVPPFRVEFTEAEIAEVLSDTEAILRSGWLILGEYTQKFEREFANQVGSRFAVAVNSGTSALEIIFRALEATGKDILVPTNTNFATAAAPMYAGANVVLYDGDLYPDLADIKKKITPSTAAIVMVHIGGYITPEIEAIRDLCREQNIYLIEDAAHAHGATFQGKHAGTFGHAGAFSFFPTKVITTCEGGMIVTDDEKLFAKAQNYRDQGKDRSGMQHVVMGNSWRLSEIEASLGLVQLKSLASDTAYRHKVMRYYGEILGDSDLLTFPGIHEQMQPSGYKCIVLLDSHHDREAFREDLKGKGILLGRGVYEVPLHHQPVFRSIANGDFPRADDFCTRHVCLPLWRFITDDQISRVINAINYND